MPLTWNFACPSLSAPESHALQLCLTIERFDSRERYVEHGNALSATALTGIQVPLPPNHPVPGKAIIVNDRLNFSFRHVKLSQRSLTGLFLAGPQPPLSLSLLLTTQRRSFSACRCSPFECTAERRRTEPAKLLAKQIMLILVNVGMIPQSARHGNFSPINATFLVRGCRPLSIRTAVDRLCPECQHKPPLPSFVFFSLALLWSLRE